MTNETRTPIAATKLFLILLAVQILSLVVLLVVGLAGRSAVTVAKPGVEAAEQALSLADLYESQELHANAAASYLAVLDDYDLPADKIANIAYKVGELYLDKLGKYPEALAAFLRAENADKDGRLAKNLSQRKVECLERMKRSSDARRVLEESSLLAGGDGAAADATAAVAEVGETKITLRQLEQAIESLPATEKEKIKTRDDKLAFLRQYVATELAYNAAKRKGYDRDPKYIEVVRQFEKNMMLQKYLSEELGDKITVSPTDLQLFYESRKKNYGDKPFADVQEQVARDFQQVKAQEAFATLFDRLSQAEKVVLHPNNLPE